MPMNLVVIVVPIIHLLSLLILVPVILLVLYTDHYHPTSTNTGNVSAGGYFGSSNYGCYSTAFAADETDPVGTPENSDRRWEQGECTEYCGRVFEAKQYTPDPNAASLNNCYYRSSGCGDYESFYKTNAGWSQVCSPHVRSYYCGSGVPNADTLEAACSALGYMSSSCTYVSDPGISCPLGWGNYSNLWNRIGPGCCDGSRYPYAGYKTISESAKSYLGSPHYHLWNSSVETELATGMAYGDPGSNIPYPGGPGIFFSDFHLLSGEYNPGQPDWLTSANAYLGSLYWSRESSGSLGTN